MYKNALISFGENQKDRVIIIDKDKNILWASNMMDEDSTYKLHDYIKPQLNEDVIDWEFYDKKTLKSFKVSSYSHSDGFYIHHLTDVSDFIGLNKELGQYSLFYKQLADFQGRLMNNMSLEYYHILDVFASLYHCSEAAVFWKKAKKHASLIMFKDGQYQVRSVRNKDEIEKYLNCKEDDVVNGMLCCCQGDIVGHPYAVTVRVGENYVIPADLYLNIAKAYLENAIIKEQVIYNSEHDAMTGLYNKGKYLERIEKEYVQLDSIAIFNMDVNDLKKMNDTYGHDMGDKLLIKAADSIRTVVEEDIHGYRMGGDEYLVVACNKTREDVENIRNAWEKALAELNKMDDGINCVIAVGIAYGEKGYDLQSLLKEADEAMYEDKRKKKKPGEEIR